MESLNVFIVKYDREQAYPLLKRKCTRKFDVERRKKLFGQRRGFV